jgi:hypothetical protein
MIDHTSGVKPAAKAAAPLPPRGNSARERNGAAPRPPEVKPAEQHKQVPPSGPAAAPLTDHVLFRLPAAGQGGHKDAAAGASFQA